MPTSQTDEMLSCLQWCNKNGFMQIFHGQRKKVPKRKETNKSTNNNTKTGHNEHGNEKGKEEKKRD